MCACVSAGGGGKDEDNCRFPWMMMSRDERRLVVRAFCSFIPADEVTETLARFAGIKARIWFCESVSRGMGTLLIHCNLLFPSRIILDCNCIMNQLDAGFRILGFSVGLD